MDYNNLTNEKLEKLVAQKDKEAICILAKRYMYEEPKNLTRAYQLLHKGEKMGLESAYVGLGEMYRLGMRFAKNEKLAREYYKKANRPYPEDEQKKAYSGLQNDSDTQKQTNSNSQNTGGTQNKTELSGNTKTQITDRALVGELIQAEAERKNNSYENTKNICQDVLRKIDSIKSGMIDYVGQKDLDIIQLDAYWILAYTAFNQQDYNAMTHYLNREGMRGLHPWNVYLQTVVHRMTNASPNVFEQDIQILKMVKDNKNLTRAERGDVYGMIADLIIEGYGAAIGEKRRAATAYYQEAANCGNTYAKEQLNNRFKI